MYTCSTHRSTWLYLPCLPFSLLEIIRWMSQTWSLDKTRVISLKPSDDPLGFPMLWILRWYPQNRIPLRIEKVKPFEICNVYPVAMQPCCQYFSWFKYIHEPLGTGFNLCLRYFDCNENILFGEKSNDTFTPSSSIFSRCLLWLWLCARTSEYNPFPAAPKNHMVDGYGQQNSGKKWFRLREQIKVFATQNICFDQSW